MLGIPLRFMRMLLDSQPGYKRYVVLQHGSEPGAAET